MKPPGIITLTTDFGISEPFVGVMKGAILSRFPDARLVDLTHEIAPQAIDEAAFWIERSYHWFPLGTVHVVVVDPGVGSERAMLAVRADGHYFVGPDNGVFSRVWHGAFKKEARRIEPRHLGFKVVSATFHGRDVFAPIAAELAAWRLSFAGLPLHEQPVLRAQSRAQPSQDGIEGSVLTLDRYGNAFTNIEASLVAQGNWVIEAGGHALRLVRTYADVGPGECLALVNSFGVVEIAERDGNASKTLGLARGDRVFARASASEAPRP